MPFSSDRLRPRCSEVCPSTLWESWDSTRDLLCWKPAFRFGTLGVEKAGFDLGPLVWEVRYSVWDPWLEKTGADPGSLVWRSLVSVLVFLFVLFTGSALGLVFGVPNYMYWCFLTDGCQELLRVVGP